MTNYHLLNNAKDLIDLNKGVFMGILILLEAISDLWEEDGQICAKVYLKKLKIEDLEGASYWTNSYMEADGQEVETTSIELRNQKLLEVNSSLIEFEEILSQINLLPENEENIEPTLSLVA